MAKFFAAADADPAVLNGKTVAVIGYGNQGRAQAINLRRARHRVIVGNQEDDSWRQALGDGFILPWVWISLRIASRRSSSSRR